MVSITFGFKIKPLCYVEVKEVLKKFDNSENKIAKQGPVGREGDRGENTVEGWASVKDREDFDNMIFPVGNCCTCKFCAILVSLEIIYKVSFSDSDLLEISITCL